MENKKEQHRFLNAFPKALMLFVALLLVIYFISVLTGSSSFFAESAEKNAKLTFREDIIRAEALADGHYSNLYEIAELLKYADSRDEVEAIIKEYIGSEKFGDLRFYSQGISYSASGAVVEFENSGREYIDKLASSNAEGCTPIYYDTSTQLDCIAFFVPVRGSQYVDGILSIVPARNIINVGSVINDKASAVAIIDADGKVLSDKRADFFTNTIGNNFYAFITTFTHNKSESDAVAEAVKSGTEASVTIDAAGDQYTLAITPLSKFDNNIYLVSMSESEGLIAPELTYIRHIVNLLIVAVAALIVGFVYAVLYQKKSKQAITAAALEDARLECPNAQQFRLTAKELMAKHRIKYAVTSTSIRNFLFISEQLGEEKCTELLKAMVKIINSILTDEECFGYAGDGRFFMLLTSTNSHAVGDKIRLLETISNREAALREKNLKIKFASGVYHVFSSRKRTIREMIECANIASRQDEENTKTSYTLFTEAARAEIEHNENIESIMESALANGEFRLFLQPKYDVKRDTIHSAEALVRWFDPRKGDYRFPGEFIPLFETNGFIVKLDHFVYIETLEYLSTAAERGEKVVPIAVNVSRVTAVSPDFINFYVGNKKKYRIPDGYLTIEFTESFAMEDYDKIANIVSALHNSGILCSIDDFGSGYSSFSILKQIDVDELKLDSIFVRRGTDVERDNKLLSTIIDLGKSMKMSVVQEGVETKEIFDKVVEMGCDVVQGYYYAKAISLEEFKLFINTNTSIKYKSLVK